MTSESSYEIGLFYLLLMALSVLTALPVWHLWKSRRLDIFEPPVWLSIYCLIVFGLTSIPYLQGWSPIHILLQPAPLWLGPALEVVVLAVLCMWLGYSVPLLSTGKRNAIRTATEKDVKTAWIAALSGVGLCLRLYMVSRGYFGYLMVRDDYFGSLAASQTVTQLSFCAQMGFLLAAVDCFQHPRSVRRRVVFLGLLSIELLFAIVSGMKSHFVFSVMLILMTYFYIRGHFPTRYVAITVLALLILTPISNAYRGEIRGGDIDRTNLSSSASSSAQIATHMWEQQGPIQLVSEGATAMLSRLSLLPSVAHVVRYIDETGDFWCGRTYVELPAMVLIPRFVWADKPVVEMGYWFSQTVLRAPSNMYHSEAITLPGDLYLNFGLPGVCVGFLLFGLILQVLYHWGVRRGDVTCLFAYLLVWLSLMQLENDALSLAAGTLKQLVLLLIIRRFAFAPRNTSAVASRGTIDTPMTGGPKTGVPAPQIPRAS